MNKQITSEDTELILIEMFKRVGLSEKQYRQFDFKAAHWFWEYEWTEKEQDDFIKWLSEFLLKNKYTKHRKYRGEWQEVYEAKKIVFDYGWKTKYE